MKMKRMKLRVNHRQLLFLSREETSGNFQREGTLRVGRQERGPTHSARFCSCPCLFFFILCGSVVFGSPLCSVLFRFFIVLLCSTSFCHFVFYCSFSFSFILLCSRLFSIILLFFSVLFGSLLFCPVLFFHISSALRYVHFSSPLFFSVLSLSLSSLDFLLCSLFFCSVLF